MTIRFNYSCVCLHACLCLGVCVCVCISLLTAFPLPEGFHAFWQLSPAMAVQTSALLFSRDSCAIYMFTLTISICCFWNNQLQGPGGGAPVNRAWLGFHDFGEGGGDSVWGWVWLCWTWGGGGGGKGWEHAQGFWRNLTVSRTRAAWSKLTNGFQTQASQTRQFKKRYAVFTFCPLTFLLIC